MKGVCCKKWVCSRGRCERVFCREMDVLLRYGRGVFDQKWGRNGCVARRWEREAFDRVFGIIFMIMIL